MRKFNEQEKKELANDNQFIIDAFSSIKTADPKYTEVLSCKIGTTDAGVYIYTGEWNNKNIMLLFAISCFHKGNLVNFQPTCLSGYILKDKDLYNTLAAQNKVLGENKELISYYLLSLHD